jgi:hypothetical protein
MCIRRAFSHPPSTPPATPPQMPRPPSQMAKILAGSPPVSCCQLVATEYKRAPMRPATTAQKAIGTKEPRKPPRPSQRRWASQAATSTPAAIKRP